MAALQHAGPGALVNRRSTRFASTQAPLHADTRHADRSRPASVILDWHCTHSPAKMSTARRAIKKCLTRREGLDFWGSSGVGFLRFGPSGPKLESVVVTTAFAEVNFVAQVSGHACRASVARFARRFAQKCELFRDFSDFASERNFLIWALVRPSISYS